MMYSISTYLGEEHGLFLGNDLEVMKKMIERIGHTIKEIKETKRQIEDSQNLESEINNSWRTS